MDHGRALWSGSVMTLASVEGDYSELIRGLSSSHCLWIQRIIIQVFCELVTVNTGGLRSVLAPSPVSHSHFFFCTPHIAKLCLSPARPAVPRAA